MVVHDLKNPVNGIAMMVQLALRKAQELPEAHRGYLFQIERTCREMMRLIQNLLEISKIEEGKMPVAREYLPVAEQAGRMLRIAVGTDLPAAMGDRALLKRVLVNLVVNALRHSGSTEVVVEGGSLAPHVVLNVIDYGRGVPAGDRERIFEKFRAVRRSPSDDPGGDTGLGLPFCKLAVERMGGRIALASTDGTSTVFTVTLPVHEAD
jgi:signal transduction histidine kinase